jgi:hypothetical protein
VNGHLNDQSPPGLRDLGADELLDIRAVLLNYPYNFAEPPKPDIDIQLVDYFANARFPFARADACDKWQVACISMEFFERLLDRRPLAEPGYLSALTTAKLIAYCLQIVEATSESLPELRGLSALTGEDIIAQIAELSQSTDAIGDISPWRQFFLCVKNPVIRRAVNNAVINRWGLVVLNVRRAMFNVHTI